jgi:hypothetical protein
MFTNDILSWINAIEQHSIKIQILRWGPPFWTTFIRRNRAGYIVKKIDEKFIWNNLQYPWYGLSCIHIPSSERNS